LLDALGIERATVLGASAGAPSAMQFALRHAARCRALVLLVPAAFVPRPGGAPSIASPSQAPWLLDAVLRSDFVFWAASRLSRDTFIGSILGTPPAVVRRAADAEQARVSAILEHLLPISARRLGLGNDAAVVSSLERYDLERIDLPTLAVSTADDRYGTFDAARYTAAHVKGARFVGYETGGHLCVGHGDALLAEIASFLKR
jgi:pimeloyl-ACP methyl ester carboxylesterase